jgi:transcriptional regulator with XRE-family HTH domain
MHSRAIPSEPLPRLLVEAQHALGGSQTDLGKLVGVSRRTVWRWQGGQSSPDGREILTIIGKVHAVNAPLAARLAQAYGETLESLGIVPPPKAIERPIEKPDPLADPLQRRAFVDAVVCAAAEALDVSPRLVRRVLAIAVARARDTGVSLDVLGETLGRRAATLKPKPAAA